MNVLRIAAVFTALATAALGAQAQTYPEKPIRVIVTTVPGPLDAFARVVMRQVEKRLKQPIVIDNRAGAGGNIGVDMVAKAPADGYTLVFALDTTFTVNPALYRKMPFDAAKDLAIIAVPVTYSQALAVNPKIKANNVAEFVALAKSSHLSYASGGNGSPSHLTMAAFMATAGIDMTHVPYKGTGASVVDVMAGQVDSVFAVGSGVLPQAKEGKLRALAVSGTTRSTAAPELPTIAESGYPGFNASFAYVLAAPAGTPDAIVQLLAREVALAMETPEVRLLDQQADYAATHLNQSQSAAWLAEMRKHWAEVVQKSGISLD